MYHLVTGLYSHYTLRPRYNVLLLGISGSGKTAWLDKVRSKVTKTGTRSLRRFQPTVGQNVLDLPLSKATLHFWDLGGDPSLRRLWNRYFEEADVLVWAMSARDWYGLVAQGDEEGKGTMNEEDDDDVEEGESTSYQRSRRRQESWEALSSLRSHSQLTSLPLLIVFTHMDQLEAAQAVKFRDQIKAIVQDKFTEWAKAEESELNEEMDQLEHSMLGKAYGRHVWNEWKVISCSAKDGAGADEFVDWLHLHAKNAQRR